jgi:hypothetical protein
MRKHLSCDEDLRPDTIKGDDRDRVTAAHVDLRNLLQDVTHCRPHVVTVAVAERRQCYAAAGFVAIGQVDPTTGAFALTVSARNAPGFMLSAPHGVAFVADPADVAVARLVQSMAVNFPSSGIGTGGNPTLDASQTSSPQPSLTSSHR